MEITNLSGSFHIYIIDIRLSDTGLRGYGVVRTKTGVGEEVVVS